MSPRDLGFLLTMVGLGVVAGSTARGQAPTIGTELPPTSGNTPGSTTSTLPPVPGSGGGTFASPAVGGGQVLGGRPGTATPRVPASISNPGQGTDQPSGSGPLALPGVAPLTEVPLYGTLDLPGAGGDDEGPADGLTFDRALGLLIRDNLDLRARQFEIPSSRADILTASLRGNPIVYGDGQLIPYGAFTKNRAGGPTQFDLNVSQPVDYSFKRKARIAVAATTSKAVELQYQDAVRIQVGNLSNAFVGVVAARETVRFAEAGLQGLDRVLAAARVQQRVDDRTSADVGLLEAQRGMAEVGMMDAREGLRRAKLTLGGYLNLPPIQAEALEIRASLVDAAPPPPPGDELAALALSCRPDVVAYRVGVSVARAALKLQQANRFADAYVLYQPYTYQNLSYLGTSHGATSWALGVTLPLPVFNRNQGNIERARVNIDQSRVQLLAVERLAVEQVRDAEREYDASKRYLDRLAAAVIPAARKAMSDTERLYLEGERDVTVYLGVQRQFNDMVRLYRDTAVRHRRSMFGLNTAVGSRILP